MSMTKTKTPYPVDPPDGFAAAELLDAEPTREDAIRLLGKAFDRLLRRNPPPGGTVASQPFVGLTRADAGRLLSIALEALLVLGEPRNTLTADELPRRRRRTTPPPPFHMGAGGPRCGGTAGLPTMEDR